MTAHRMTVDLDTALIGLVIGPLDINIALPSHLSPELKQRYLPFPGDGHRALAVNVELRPELFGGPFRPVSTSWSKNGFTAASYNFRTRYRDGAAAVQVADDWRAVDAAIRVLTSALLLERGALLLHASGVVRNGEAYVFCGPSESGKTTLASMNDCGLAGSDELICVQPRGSRLAVFDTPFWNRRPPVGFKPADAKGLFFIYQDSSTFVRPLGGKEIVLEAWRNAFFDPEDTHQARHALAVCRALAATPVYRFHFTLDEDEVWRCLGSI